MSHTTHAAQRVSVSPLRLRRQELPQFEGSSSWRRPNSSLVLAAAVSIFLLTAHRSLASASGVTCLEQAQSVVTDIHAMIQLSDDRDDLTRRVSRQLPATSDSRDPNRLLDGAVTLQQFTEAVRKESAYQAFQFLAGLNANNPISPNNDRLATVANCQSWLPVLVKQATDLCSVMSRFADVDPIGRIGMRSRAEGCHSQSLIEESSGGVLRFNRVEFKCEFFRVLAKMEELYQCAPRMPPSR